EGVRERGLSVGVLSNFPLPSLGASLGRVGLADLVDVAGAAPAIGASKPDARAYRHVIAALGVAPQECVLVDDELPCVEGALAVGIRAYHLDRLGKHSGESSTIRDLGSLL